KYYNLNNAKDFKEGLKRYAKHAHVYNRPFHSWCLIPVVDVHFKKIADSIHDRHANISTTVLYDFLPESPTSGKIFLLYPGNWISVWHGKGKWDKNKQL